MPPVKAPPKDVPIKAPPPEAYAAPWCQKTAPPVVPVGIKAPPPGLPPQPVPEHEKKRKAPPPTKSYADPEVTVPIAAPPKATEIPPIDGTCQVPTGSPAAFSPTFWFSTRQDLPPSVQMSQTARLAQSSQLEDPLITEVSTGDIVADADEELRMLDDKIKQRTAELEELGEKMHGFETSHRTVSVGTVTTPRLKLNSGPIAGTGSQTDVEVKIADDAGRESCVIVKDEGHVSQTADGSGHTIALTVQSSGGQPVTINIWLSTPIAKEEAEFCSKAEQTMEPEGDHRRRSLEVEGRDQQPHWRSSTDCLPSLHKAESEGRHLFSWVP